MIQQPGQRCLLTMQLDRVAEAEIARLLNRDVKQAELPELLRPAQRANIDRA